MNWMSCAILTADCGERNVSAEVALTLVKRHSNVMGDFMWTTCYYLGEVSLPFT